MKNEKHVCIICDYEGEDVVLTEFKDGWVFACQSIAECTQRCAQKIVKENLEEYHKGEACKNKPETLCVEGHCVKCELNKE